MRARKLAWNTVSSMIYQITRIICGFILPRLILFYYGSSINGLVNSIAQFLSIITFLELGIGAVVQSALYKPLADNDNRSVSEIMKSAEKFFRKIALILLLYVIVLVIVYPSMINKEYDALFTGMLIISISISSFAEYYFGIVERLLLTADQRGYIQYTAQTTTVVLNTLVSAVLIHLGASIQAVKFIGSLIFLIRPIFLRYYTSRHYQIDRKIEYSGEPIKQKWNGLAQHFSAVILDGTDIIVLTLFSSLPSISIYSVYYLVVSGVKQLFISMTNGIQSLMGELWAKQERDELNKLFSWVEWVIHSAVTVIFGCSATLIVPFVLVYTKDISDTQYAVPVFGLLLTLAHGFHCLRLPYNLMIFAGNHYRQTQWNYVVSACLNIIISIIVVRRHGMVGVAVGTLAAMLFQTVWMAYYISRNLIQWPFRAFIKQMIVDTLVFCLAFVLCRNIQLGSISYISWIIMAIKVTCIWIVISLILNMVIYPEKLKDLTSKILKRSV